MGKKVCYSTKNRAYGNFTFQRNCELVAIRLRHATGKFFKDGKTTRWATPGRRFWTIVTNDSDSFVYPTYLSKTEGKYGLFDLDGFDVNDDLIYHSNHNQPMKVPKGDVYRVWFLTDFNIQVMGKGKPTETAGIHCVNVDVSCL